jgi:hypothetical protein
MINSPDNRVIPQVFVLILSAFSPMVFADEILDEFCADVQRVLAATTVSVENVAYDEIEVFIKSKASIRPLVTRQYVHRDEQARPRMISCKVKTSDMLLLEYGDDAAGTEGACQSVNYLTVQRVAGASDSTKRPYGKYRDVVLEPDETGVSGVNWLKPYQMIWAEQDVLHIQSKALRVDWGNERFKSAPARFRGTHYCHLVAPSYLRRVLDGEVGVPGPDM